MEKVEKGGEGSVELDRTRVGLNLIHFSSNPFLFSLYYGSDCYGRMKERGEEGRGREKGRSGGKRGWWKTNSRMQFPRGTNWIFLRAANRPMPESFFWSLTRPEGPLNVTIMRTCQHLISLWQFIANALITRANVFVYTVWTWLLLASSNGRDSLNKLSESYTMTCVINRARREIQTSSRWRENY